MLLTTQRRHEASHPVCGPGRPILSSILGMACPIEPWGECSGDSVSVECRLAHEKAEAPRRSVIDGESGRTVIRHPLIGLDF
ncbi:hypothetical protein BO78DRAFT_156744 [Aspergillus sclerotiicarbonarius CBS 121057]|uniref:Uncharacterized protein n=1 Tax=Aspergillus sclerotiicarbonarius (strain CBS 121057 / IBT 28362) TaxID=1448318 RepID=A0A319EMR8_ASPSB|nr:hypothetical protein BO78DRAFT_156744 [Aspergillus sclerotiicarbonarius CBS 121057]